MRTTPERVSIYGSRFRLILLIRLISARKAEVDEEAEYYENYDAR